MLPTTVRRVSCDMLARQKTPEDSTPAHATAQADVRLVRVVWVVRVADYNSIEAKLYLAAQTVMDVTR